MRVLVCEDDDLIRNGLAEILREEGYTVLEARNGAEALERFDREAPDFLILDIMMPGKSGYDVCRELRAKRGDVPIMFLSAKSEEFDRVLGLELGADDYVVKPFGVHEIVSRIRAITRRCFGSSEQVVKEHFQIAGIEVFPQELRAERSGRHIDLSLRDVKLLALFSSAPGKVFDRDTIFNECWGHNYLPNSRTLDQHISKLRKKLGDDPKQPELIETVHGVGYRYPRP